MFEENNIKEDDSQDDNSQESLIDSRQNTPCPNQLEKAHGKGANKTIVGVKRQHRFQSAWFSVLLLCFANGLNYVNRYTLPTVVGRLKTAFDLKETQLGLIQTTFELVYVVSSPLFGYLGDRYDRRYLLLSAMLIGNLSGFLTSFVQESDSTGTFVLFTTLRAVLALAEAAFTNIAPTLIADMYVGKTRTIVISFFQFAIPIGCGFGYILTSLIVDYFDDWRAAFRITPVPVIVTMFSLLICLNEPRRGEAEHASVKQANTSFIFDIFYILNTRSFTLTTIAFVGVAFATGALCYWTPYLINILYIINGMEYR